MLLITDHPFRSFANSGNNTVERGYTEDEINDWIDEAVAEVRPHYSHQDGSGSPEA